MKSRHPRERPDVLEQAITRALRPDAFITNRECFSFVAGLETVERAITALIPAHPRRSVALFETLLAAAYEKAEEIDDSGNTFGRFVQTLFCGWVTARQRAKADRDESAARLLLWMERDPYGYWLHIDRDLTEALDTQGLAAFERCIRERFESLAATRRTQPARGRSLLSADDVEQDSLRRRLAEMLRAIYVRRRDVAAYVAFVERTGLAADDCRAIAEMLAARRRPEDALAWTERGLRFDGPGSEHSGARWQLTRLRRQLLVRLGRKGEALEDAWQDYQRHPFTLSYREFMAFVPRGARAAWHERAMRVALGAYLPSAIELLLESKEIGRLVERLGRADDAELAELSHHVAEPAAEALEEAHPGAAARLWRAQGLRIVDAGKSRYYGAAIRDFARARACFERAGLRRVWDETVLEVRAAHRRKSGFMPGFERVAAGVQGAAPPRERSFLERARARWDMRPE